MDQTRPFTVHRPPSCGIVVPIGTMVARVHALPTNHPHDEVRFVLDPGLVLMTCLHACVQAVQHRMALDGGRDKTTPSVFLCLLEILLHSIDYRCLTHGNQVMEITKQPFLQHSSP